MPMYDISREERGTRFRTFRVFAENQDEAMERIFQEDIQPDSEYFQQEKAYTNTRRLPDCTCGICITHGFPWACQDSDPEDEVLDLAQRERIWNE